MAGNKETKEVVLAALKVAPILVAALKDGVQVEDFGKLYAEIMLKPEVKNAVMAAYENIKLVSEETKDLDLTEMIDIVSAALPELQKIIQSLKAA